MSHVVLFLILAGFIGAAAGTLLARKNYIIGGGLLLVWFIVIATNGVAL